MATEFETSQFEYQGWTVKLAGNACETALVVYADVYQADVHRYRITLSGPTTDESAVFKKLAAMAASYIDECVAELAQRNADLTSAFRRANPNADALHSRLIYVSWSPYLISVDLPDILRESKKNNARGDITGALCFLKGVYMQYLEGPTAAVEALWQKIEVDGRHNMPKLLSRCLVTERSLKGWDMAMIQWNGESEDILRTYANDAWLDLYQVPAEAATAFFSSLKEAKSWTIV
jgi:hypothetical protein